MTYEALSSKSLAIAIRTIGENFYFGAAGVCRALNIPTEHYQMWLRAKSSRPVLANRPRRIDEVLDDLERLSRAASVPFAPELLRWHARVPNPTRRASSRPSAAPAASPAELFPMKGMPVSRLADILNARKRSLFSYVYGNKDQERWPKHGELRASLKRYQDDIAAFLRWYRGEQRHPLKLSFWLLSDGLNAHYFPGHRYQQKGLSERQMLQLIEAAPDVPIHKPARLGFVLEYLLLHRHEHDAGVPVRWYQVLRPQYPDHVLHAMASNPNPFWLASFKQVFRRKHGLGAKLKRVVYRDGDPRFETSFEKDKLWPQWAWRLLMLPADEWLPERGTVGYYALPHVQDWVAECLFVE